MPHQALRTGISAMETVIAFVLLGVIVSSVGKFAAYVDRGVQDRRLALRLQWEIENAREVIGSWPLAEITTARIEKLAISSELAEVLSQPHWTAIVQPLVISGQPNEAQPTPATVQAISVSLQLQAGYRGQQIKPVELVFWVLADATSTAANDSAALDSSAFGSAKVASPSESIAVDSNANSRSLQAAEVEL